jgi:hypothetical protein
MLYIFYIYGINYWLLHGDLRLLEGGGNQKSRPITVLRKSIFSRSIFKKVYILRVKLKGKTVAGRLFVSLV